MDIKPTLVLGWFAASFITLVASIGGWFYIQQETFKPPATQNFHLYSALPNQNSVIEESIISSDGRAKIVESLFKKYKAPLHPFSETFIQVADKYQLDWRLLPSIAMQESNGGKRVIGNSYNPFGFGIYGSKVIRFDSWVEAIEKVGQALKEEYLDKGLKNPEQIMTKYTPPSLEKGGSWAKGVYSFMFELQ